MNIEKTRCDRLSYEYKDIFNHLEFILNIEFILNKMNDLLNNYGCGLSEEELEKLNNLFLKLETGKCEIIEFQETLCKINTEKLQQELQRKDNIISELKEKLKEARKELQPGELIIGQGLIDNILDKIKELEKM